MVIDIRNILQADVIGYTGSQGIIGYTGSRGDTGFNGSSGFTGSQGPIGFTGSRGDTGFTGSSGFTGSIGFTGSRGNTGFVGSQGALGYTGSQGIMSVVNDTTTDSDNYYPTMIFNVTSGSWTTANVSSTKLFYNPSTGTLTATNFNTLSDTNLKTNQEPIINAEELINRIETIKFTWKDSELSSYGVIAQQIETVLPELVTASGKIKYVNYIPLIAILIEGFKDLSRRVKSLEKE